MTTPALFDLGLPVPHHATIARRRDVQMARVAEAAERARARFRADACAFVLAYLADHGDTPGEVLSEACKAAGIVPHDDRAFGPVYFALSRAGQIVKVGHVARQRGNGTAGGNVWRRA